jgi:hypothetical protein
MGPLTGGKGNGFQARRECPTADEKSQEGSHGGTRKFSATPMFVGRFLLHKICALTSLQGWPRPGACAKTGGEATPCHAQRVMTSAGGGPTDLIQVLRIAKPPLVCLRLRRCIDALWQPLCLAPELEQVGQSCGRFGQAACRRPWQSADVALDEGLIDICNGLPLLEQPSSDLIAASQVTSDAVPSISLLPQGGGKIIKVGTPWSPAKPVERRCPKQVCLAHELLLLFYGG